MRRVVFALLLLAPIACADTSDNTTTALGEASGAAASVGVWSHEVDGNSDVFAQKEPSTNAASTDALAGIGGTLRSANVENAPVTRQDWMAQTRGLIDRSLNTIFIPGTHDSGTYTLESVYGRPLDDLFAPDAVNPFVRAGQFFGITKLWSKTQERTIAEQLDDGIRYLDLRACREKNGTLRACHGLYGAKMSDILQQVAVFAAAHPRELLLLHTGGFAGFSDEDHDALASLYTAKLGDRIVDYTTTGLRPQSTLREFWTEQPGKNVIVIYNDERRPSSYWPGTTVFNSWKNTWDRQTKKDSLGAALAKAWTERFFLFSGAATPDSEGNLIARSLDPTGTYPKSLSDLANDTNPVVLGWLRDEWSTKQANVIALDFYNRTCVFELTQLLNGNAAASLEGCNIGTDTNWSKWLLGYERFGYGRGVGTPLGCAANEEMVSGLCYPKCAPGYSSNIGFPYLCMQPCPAGYRDDGLTCFRDASIIGANNSACPWYDVCGLTFARGCSSCPAGYVNDGCTCRRNPHMIVKTRYERGVGKVVHACDAGQEKSGALCYPTCSAGFHGVGPMCIPNN
ncbi:MAG TPA: hypothetical protein VM580_19140 [Labilithrix sp.]|nr:hypothetical protein [Labilithrix sp.]